MNDGYMNTDIMVKTAIDFIVNAVERNRSHAGKILAKTGDTEGYHYMMGFCDDLENKVVAVGKEYRS